MKFDLVCVYFSLCGCSMVIKMCLDQDFQRIFSQLLRICFNAERKIRYDFAQELGGEGA